MRKDTNPPLLPSEDTTPVTNDADRNPALASPAPTPTPSPAPDGDDVGRDAVGSVLRRRGQQPISWRRNLYAIFAAQLMAIMAFSMRSPFLPFFLSDLGLHTLSQQQLWSGIVNAGGAAVMAVAAPIWGNLADRKGRRPMLLRAQFAAFCTIGLMGFAVAPWQILGLRMVEGALTGTVTAATALVAATVPKERLGYGLGLIQTAIFSGAAIGPLVGGVLADQIGFRPTFWAASCMMLTGGLITLFLVREQFVPHVKTEDEAPPVSAWKLLMTPLLLGMTLTMFMIRGAEGAVQPIMSLYIEQLSGMAANASTLAGLVLGILGVTSAISSIFLGRLGDKRGYRTILMVCALGAGLIYLPMAAAQAWWHMFILQAIFGVFAGGMIPSANALVAQGTPPDRRGVVYGMMATATSIGGVVGPLMGSFIAAGFGARMTFLLTGAMLLSLVAILFVTQRRHHAVPDREIVDAVIGD
ncbi:MAG: MFS transporter [Thermomicrobiales bacterium]